MKILKCKICGGEVEGQYAYSSSFSTLKITCHNCGFSNAQHAPEVFVIRKKSTSDEE